MEKLIVKQQGQMYYIYTQQGIQIAQRTKWAKRKNAESIGKKVGC